MSNRLLVLTGVLGAALLAATVTLFPLIKSGATLGKQSAGFYLLPTNQLLRPWGEQTLIKGRPVDVAIDSRKQLLAVSNSRSLLIVDAVSGAQVADIPTRATSYLGVAFRP